MHRVLLAVIAAAAELHAPRTVEERAAASKVCPRVAGCRLALHDAGVDAQGQGLSVVEVQGASAGAPAGCSPRESWLLVKRGAALFGGRKLLERCGGQLEVGPNSLEITEPIAGGTAHRAWQLSPLRLKAEGQEQAFPPVGSEVSTWSWERFSGEGEWYAPTCNADGHPPPAVDEEQSHHRSYAYQPIPEVEALPEGFAEGGWAQAHLGGCALLVDGARGRGFTGFTRKPADPKDSSFRVLASGRRLFVEVTDDAWVGPSADWHHDDHLELWLGTGAGMTGDLACLEGRASKDAHQWGIRVTDGKVFSGYGTPTQPVEVEFDRRQLDAGPATVRLKLTLPPGCDRVSLAYSDSDQPGRQDRVISSSRLQFGWLPSLGRLQHVEAPQGRCVLRGGALEPEPSANVPGEGPLFRSPALSGR